jgi:hypothetical protein
MMTTIHNLMNATSSYSKIKALFVLKPLFQTGEFTEAPLAKLKTYINVFYIIQNNRWEVTH